MYFVYVSNTPVNLSMIYKHQNIDEREKNTQQMESETQTLLNLCVNNGNNTMNSS